MKTKALGRRSVLRGMMCGASVTVGLPLLECMLGTHGDVLADGQKLPLRLVLWGWSHGVDLPRWVPTSAGQGSAWQLAPDMASFAGVKEYTSLITGTTNPMHGHPGMYTMFSGIPTSSTGTLRAPTDGPTLDLLAARMPAFDTGSGIRSLNVGITRNPNSDPSYKALSIFGAGRFNMPDTDPVSVFDKLFKGGASAQGPAGGAPAAGPGRPSASAPSGWVVDTVRWQLEALRSRVSVNDRARIEEHLEAVHDLDKRLKVPATVVEAGDACQVPKAPTPARLPNDGTMAHNLGFVANARLMNELVAMAFACDRTRIFTYAYTLPAGWDRFAGYNSTEHGVSHGTSWPRLGWPHVPMKMEAIADLLDRLKAVREGTANVLHNSVVYATTDCTEPRTHTERNIPVIIAGRAGGRLRGDVHFRQPGGNGAIAGATVATAIGLASHPFKSSAAAALLA